MDIMTKTTLIVFLMFSVHGCSESLTTDDYVVIGDDVLKPGTYTIIHLDDGRQWVRYNGRNYTQYEYDVVKEIK